MDENDFKNIDQSEKTVVMVLDNERFFANYKNKRVETAWSLAGAKHYLVGSKHLEDDFKMLEKMNRKPVFNYCVLL